MLLHGRQTIGTTISAIFHIAVALILGACISIPRTTLAGERRQLHHHCPVQPSDGSLLIDVLAVGQGDSTFIRTPNGTTMLIDGGNPGRGTQDVLPTLRQCYKIKSLDYIVLTHPHADHFGGLVDVLKEIPVNKAIYDTGSADGQAFARYEKLADGTGKRRIPELGDKAIVGDDQVQFRIVAINGHVLGGKIVSVFGEDGAAIDKNCVSIAMVVSFGKFRYYTGGDLCGGGNHTPDIESPVAEVVGRVDVMKSDHHGSATGNNDHLLSALRPHQVLISVGLGEANSRYHLPNAATIARLMALPFIENIFQTSRGEGRAPAATLSKVRDEDSDIIVIANPDSYWIDGNKYDVGLK
jgi:beta-lactamase superfamily II metal-dependent hydrolase